MNCAGEQTSDTFMDQISTKHNTPKLSPKSDLIDDSVSVLLAVCDRGTPPRECKQRLGRTSYAERILADLIKDCSMNSFDEYEDISQTWSKNEHIPQTSFISNLNPVQNQTCESSLSYSTKCSDTSLSINSSNKYEGIKINLNYSPETSGTVPSGLSFHSIETSADNQRVPSPSRDDLILELMSRSQYCAHSFESELLSSSENKTTNKNNSALNRRDPDGAEEDPARRIAVAVRRSHRHASIVKPTTCSYSRSREDKLSRSSRPSSSSSKPLASSTMITDTTFTDSNKPTPFPLMTSSAFNESCSQLYTLGMNRENVQRGRSYGTSSNTKKRMRSLYASSNLHKVEDSQYPTSSNNESSTSSENMYIQHLHNTLNCVKRRKRTTERHPTHHSESVSHLQNDTDVDVVRSGNKDHSNEKQTTLPRTSTTVWSVEERSVATKDKFSLKPLNGQRCPMGKSRVTGQSYKNCNRSSHLSSFDYDYTCTDSSDWYEDDIENTFGDILVPNNSCFSTANCETLSRMVSSTHTTNRYNSFLVTSVDDTSKLGLSKCRTVIRRTSTPLPSHCIPLFKKGCKRSHSERRGGFDKRTLKQRLKDFRQSCSKEKSSVPSIRTLARL